MMYNIILADPPWNFKTYSAKGQEYKSAANHYQTQSLEWIKNLNVNNIAADDCCLFLWVTMPCLPQAFEVIMAWGFTYKTCAFTWVKKNKKADSLFWGLGYWTRANSELCLLATKGNPKRISKSVHQVIMSPIKEHSSKPDEARNRIVQLCGNIPRIELFARNKTDGWACWGNEVDYNKSLDIKLLGIKR